MAVTIRSRLSRSLYVGKTTSVRPSGARACDKHNLPSGEMQTSLAAIRGRPLARHPYRSAGSGRLAGPCHRPALVTYGVRSMSPMDRPEAPWAPPPVPPALIGALLLLAVVLAIVFVLAAQVVQTP